MSITTRNRGLRDAAAFRAAVNEIAALSVRLRILEAKRDKRLQAVRDEHEPEIQAAADQRDALLALAEAYAAENRETVFLAGQKSGECELATYGMRIGNPTLKLLNKRWTWAKVLEVVKKALGEGFIRVQESLDKDAIKAAFGDSPSTLAEIGVRIEQTEAFWVEPKDRESAQ